MERNELRRYMEERLQSLYNLSYDRENEILRIERQEDKFGVNVRLGPIVAKAKVSGKSAVDDVIDYIEKALAMPEDVNLSGNEGSILPVIRSASFAKTTKSGEELVHSPHTAETEVFYALDFGDRYRLIEQRHLNEYTREDIDRFARANLERFSTEMTSDELAGNIFYFLSKKDGFEASRVLREDFLRVFERRVEGEMLVGVPHQDVLVVADVRNDQGYDVMQQLMFDFFTNGRVPITALPFSYREGKLEPIFVVGKKKGPNGQ